MNQLRKVAWAAIASAAIALTPAMSQEPIGQEFRVNRGEAAAINPGVVSAPDGAFLVVWLQVAPPGAQLFGQRHDPSGNRLGGSFPVGPLTNTARPALSAAADGSLVVVWDQFPTGADPDILGRLLDASGLPLGTSFPINAYTTGNQTLPDVARDGAGGFLAVWQDNIRDGSSGGIFGRRFDADGDPLGDDFRINTYTTGHQAYPSVSSDVDGNFVVVWESADHAGGNTAVLGQRYDISGTAVGAEFLVSTPVDYPQSTPDVASGPDGSFVVSWASSRPSTQAEVFGRLFNGSGVPIGGEFQVNTFTTDEQTRPKIASDAGGGFVIVWESEGQDGSLAGVFGQQFATGGTRIGEEFQVNTYTSLRQHVPTVSSDADGDFVVVWAKADSPAGAYNVKAQRFAGPGLHLSIDGTCPGAVTATIANAPPGTEVAVIAAANTSGFVKGGQLCPGTRLSVGEPFQLPPTFVIVDGEGRASIPLELTAERCFVEALALADCQTSGAVAAPAGAASGALATSRRAPGRRER